MKKLIAILLMGATSAMADTTQLGAEGCSTYCFAPVPNSAGWNFGYLDYAFQYRRLVISVNGVVYDSGLFNIQPVVTLEGPSTYLYTINTTIYSPEGKAMEVANLQFREESFCSYKCHVVTTLLGGALSK